MNEELTECIYEWMSALAQATMHDLNREAHAAGLSLPQINVLMHLHYRGPTEAMRLSDVMLTSPAAASQMIERLAQQGLVERGAAPGDRRVRIVKLLPAGQAVVDATLTSRQHRAAELAEQVPAGEHAAVLEALVRLQEAIKEKEKGG